MALQWMDEFNTYGAGLSGVTAALQGTPYAAIWPNSTTQFPADPDPLATGRVFRVGAQNVNSNTADTRISLPTPGTNIGIGCRRWYGALPASSGFRPVVFSYRDAGNNKVYELQVELNGALSIYNGANVQLATTTAPVITGGAWYHIAMRINTVTGTVKVQVEGNNIAALTSYTFTPTSALFYFIGMSSRQDFNSDFSPNHYMKDLTIWDGSGSQNNDMVGTVGVYRLSLASDVSSGWARSSGTTDYGLLNETGPDDASLISAGSALPAASIMGISSLPAAIVGIRGIMPLIRLQKSDAGDCSIVDSIVSGASTANGATKTVLTSFAYYYDIIELDPATAALWTPTAVNAAKVKINRTV